PPVPHPGWSRVLDATNFRSLCPQHDSRGIQLGSEDCLFLNVFTPNIRRQQIANGRNSQLPVMVYIQGLTLSHIHIQVMLFYNTFTILTIQYLLKLKFLAESFENGDSALYGAEKLLDRDVVVVTFNYRVGLLGFLSTDDENASGNWGLHDKTKSLALEWVRNNIASFHGDPNTVTIFGQGAGLEIFKLNLCLKGLFHRAIAQSGSALCDWAIERSPLTYAREVAQSVGCPTSRNSDLVECLRKIHFSQLLKAQSRGK
ncbi:unnamed protein product, partial [Sphagnum jensenii]